MALTAATGNIEDLSGAVEAHFGAVEATSRALGSSRVMKVHPGIEEAYSACDD
jgi:hypothetical protein